MKKYLYSLGFMIICMQLLIGGCNKKQASYHNNEMQTTKETSTKERETTTKKETTPSVTTEKAEEKMLLADIGDEEIYLYQRENDVELNFKGKSVYYDWNCLTPRNILPRLYYEDIDGDQNNELIAILYMGSGTGVSVEELHVVEVENKDNEYRFDDYCYNTYVEELKERTEVIVNEDELDKVCIRVDVGQFKADVENEENDIVGDEAVFGQVVSFEYKDGEIVGTFGVGINKESIVTPIFVGDIVASVRYDDGVFRLEQFAEFVGFEEIERPINLKNKPDKPIEIHS